MGDGAQTGAEDEGFTMGIVILKAVHEKKKKLTVEIHGPADIAKKDDSKGFGFGFLGQGSAISSSNGESSAGYFTAPALFGKSTFLKNRPFGLGHEKRPEPCVRASGLLWRVWAGTNA